MGHGKISKENTTMSFVIPKGLKEKISIIAARENRSTSNLIVNLIDNYIKLNENKNHLLAYHNLLTTLYEKDDTE